MVSATPVQDPQVDMQRILEEGRVFWEAKVLWDVQGDCYDPVGAKGLRERSYQDHDPYRDRICYLCGRSGPWKRMLRHLIPKEPFTPKEYVDIGRGKLCVWKKEVDDLEKNVVADRYLTTCERCTCQHQGITAQQYRWQNTLRRSLGQARPDKFSGTVCTILAEQGIEAVLRGEVMKRMRKSSPSSSLSAWTFRPRPPGGFPLAGPVRQHPPVVPTTFPRLRSAPYRLS